VRDLSLCDLHYHLNIFRCPKSSLSGLLEEHRLSIEKAEVRFIASTEHVYKNPLDSYLRLIDLCQGLPVTVIPGLEWIGREGVEIVFWWESRGDLEEALKTLKPYSHSVWETGAIGRDLGAVSCIPHPFTPGRTGAATNLGLEAFRRLSEQVDYLEKYNGIGRQFGQFFLYDRLGRLWPGLRRKVQSTAQVPEEHCIPDLGWSAGSDAHFPGELYLAGEHADMTGPGWFEALKSRLRFEKVDLDPHKPKAGLIRRNLASVISVMDEALIKHKHR
jgi:hypothetical protein